MSGNWRKPEADAAAFFADGCVCCGDVGRFDERGDRCVVDSPSKSTCKILRRVLRG